MQLNKSNVWTEADNLLNNFRGRLKERYVQHVMHLVHTSSEKYLPSINAVSSHYFHPLGITDSLLLLHAKECELLITSDSKLSDYAHAEGIDVYDMVQVRNKNF